MFKIAKLEQVNNEKVSINCILQEKNNYDNGKNIKDERFKTLSFKVSGNNYSIEFHLNVVRRSSELEEKDLLVRHELLVQQYQDK